MDFNLNGFFTYVLFFFNTVEKYLLRMVNQMTGGNYKSLDELLNTTTTEAPAEPPADPID